MRVHWPLFLHFIRVGEIVRFLAGTYPVGALALRKKEPQAPLSSYLPPRPVLSCSSSAAGERRWGLPAGALPTLSSGSRSPWAERALRLLYPCVHRPSLPRLEHHRLTFSLVFIFFKQVAVPDQCLQLLLNLPSSALQPVRMKPKQRPSGA